MCRYLTGDVLKMWHLINERKRKMRKGVETSKAGRKMLKKD